MFQKSLAESRFETWQQAKLSKEEFHDALRDQQAINKKQEEIMNDMEAKLKSETEKKRLEKEFEGRGGARWPNWIVLLVCDLLVNGTDPSAVPLNIASMHLSLYGNIPAELPCVNFVRECRVLIQIIGETIVAMRLATATNWKQLFFDGTSRRQTPFQALLISVLGDDGLTIEPMILSSCIFVEEEDADSQLESIMKKVSSLIPLKTRDYF